MDALVDSTFCMDESIQLLTPPQSHTSESPRPSTATDQSQEPPTVISVSTTFYPGALVLPQSSNQLTPDVVLLSSDSVFFYIHKSILLEQSNNHFNGLLHPNNSNTAEQQRSLSSLTKSAEEGKSNESPLPLMLSLPESSQLINVLLHLLYNLSCARYNPSLDVLSDLPAALRTYGYDPASLINPQSELFHVLISHAPSDPLRLYALAASAGLDALAVQVSRFTLPIQLCELTDSLCETIGPVYLKRLFFLHLGRTEALKRLLLSPPEAHDPVPQCSLLDQKTLTRAWSLATAYFAWDARPDTSVSTLNSSLTPLVDHLRCQMCRQNLQLRIRNLLFNWSQVKSTI